MALSQNGNILSFWRRKVRHDVRIAELPDVPGWPKTGVDDLLVSADGIELATKAITTAKPFHQFELERRQQQERTEFIGTPVTSRFLDQDPSAVLPADGILGIRLPKGRGKTSGVFRKLAAEGKDQLRLVMLVPLRRLRDSAALQAKAVGIELRTFAASHPNTTDLGLQAIKQGQHRDKNWTLCAESLMHVTDEMLAGATVGVDEARQLTTGILESETFKGQLRDDVIKRLLQKLKLAQRVILLDADLDDATLRFWRWLVCGGGAIASPQVQLWCDGIDEKPPGFPFQMLGGKADDAERFAIQLALSDRKVLIATDSAERAERIEKALKKERPTLRVLALTSKRTGTRDAKAFFADPSQAIRNWDCVVTSPSLRTGVSIDQRGCFDAIALLLGGVTFHDRDAAKALWRVRDTTIPRFVYCPEYVNPEHAYWNNGAIRHRHQNQVLQVLEAQVAELSRAFEQHDFDATLDAAASTSRLTFSRFFEANRFHAAQIAAGNFVKADLKLFLRGRLLMDGCIEAADLSPDGLSPLDLDLDETKEMCRAEAIGMHLAGVPRIGAYEFETLQRRSSQHNASPLTEEERQQLALVPACEFFGVRDTGGTLGVDQLTCFAQQRQAVHQLIALFNTDQAFIDWANRLPRHEQTLNFFQRRSLMAADIDFSLQYVPFLKAALVDEVIRDGLQEPVDLSDEFLAIRLVETYRQSARMKQLFREFTSRAEPPTRKTAPSHLRTIFKRLGFAVESVQRRVNGKRERFPQLQPTAPLMALVQQVHDARLGYSSPLMDVHEGVTECLTSFGAEIPHETPLTPSEPSDASDYQEIKNDTFFTSDRRMDQKNQFQESSNQPAQSAQPDESNPIQFIVPHQGSKTCQLVDDLAAVTNWQPQVIEKTSSGHLWIEWPELTADDQPEVDQLMTRRFPDARTRTDPVTGRQEIRLRSTWVKPLVKKINDDILADF